MITRKFRILLYFLLEKIVLFGYYTKGDVFVIHAYENRVKRRKNQYISPTTHSFTEIVYYHSGINCELTIDSKKYNALPGYVSVSPADVVHSERHHSYGTVSYIQPSLSVDVPAGLYPDMQHISYLFDSIAHELKNQTPLYEKMCDLYCKLICTELLRTLEAKNSGKKDLTYIKNYICDNYTVNISIARLAEQVGYSEDRFRHLFTESFGVSPQRMIVSLRLEKAKKMLLSQSLSCTDIAHECGFYDASQFARMFAAEYGLSPSKYRKEQLEND